MRILFPIPGQEKKIRPVDCRIHGDKFDDIDTLLIPAVLPLSFARKAITCPIANGRHYYEQLRELTPTSARNPPHVYRTSMRKYLSLTRAIPIPRRRVIETQAKVNLKL